MAEPLSQADRDIMSSRGWDPDNASQATRYLDLREQVGAGNIKERELNTEMNKLDNAQLAEMKA